MDSIEYFLYNRLPKKLTKFEVVGLISSPEFQKCRFFVEKLHECFPKDYAKPIIRAMLNLDWSEFLTKMCREYGKRFYLLRAPVVVFVDDEFLGNDKDLIKYTSKSYTLETNIDFQELADQELITYFTDIIENKKRKFVYLTVAIDETVIGSMLFLLYNDLVPNTCSNFLNFCNEKTKGYKGTRIHRIARFSWIQCGGYNLVLKHMKDMPCENYAVPHNRRGVLSMCNSRRHEENRFQFYITLEQADWMDYNYVAFGQLVQGAEILNMIEKAPTYYQHPLHKIEIVDCGEFDLCSQLHEEYKKMLNLPYAALFDEKIVGKPDNVDSTLSWTGFKSGKYCLKTDLRSYLPFTTYSTMFETYMIRNERYYPQEEEFFDYKNDEKSKRFSEKKEQISPGFHAFNFNEISEDVAI